MIKNIWSNNCNEGYFRKKIHIGNMPQKAYARIFADTGYELFINGRFAATVDEWCNTRDYDVLLFLQPGDNIIAIHTINHGGHRGLAFELAVDDKSVVVTDNTWKMANYEKWGWTLLDYDDSEWENARELNLVCAGEPQWWTLPGTEPKRIVPTLDCSQFFNGSIPKTCNSPYWRVKKKEYKVSNDIKDLLGKDYANRVDTPMLPPIHKYSNILNSTADEKNDVMIINNTSRYTGPSFIVDFGMQTIGYFRMKIKSGSSVSFRLYYGETLDEATYEISRDACQNKMLREEYRVFAGEQEFESRMRVEHRFVRVEFFDCGDVVEVSDFAVRTTLYPVNRRGYFKCDDEKYNKLWLMGERTVLYCMQEYYLDAPKRDRFLWTGDARLEALANYYMFGDKELMKFCLEELEKVQYPNGGIPSSYGEGCSMLWDYVAWYIISYYDYYMFTGDKSFVEKHTESIYRATDYLISIINEEGVIDVPGNPLGVWMVELDEYVGKDPYLNKIYLKSLEVSAFIAELTGNKEASEKYSLLYEKSKICIEKLLENNSLCREFDKISHTQVQYEIAESHLNDGNVKGMIDKINMCWLKMTDINADCMYESAYLDDEQGRIDEHYTENPLYVSYCHGWTAAANILLPMGIAGIKPVEAGFKTVEIKPNTEIFKKFECAVPTPYGDIAVKYENNVFSYCLPVGITAKIIINDTKTDAFGSGSIKL